MTILIFLEGQLTWLFINLFYQYLKSQFFYEVLHRQKLVDFID